MAASVSGRNIVLASRPLAQGFSCGFPLIPPFQVLIQDETERITGIEKMPDFFLCFSADNAYAVFGDGPNDAGAGGFSGAKNIGPNQGMVPGAPHLSTSLGAFYISERGLYVVTPNTQLNYLGAQVEDSFVENGSVKSIILDDDENEIRMLMQNKFSSEVSRLLPFVTSPTPNMDSTQMAREFAFMFTIHSLTPGISGTFRQEILLIRRS